ncbi:hypothetical protein EJ02DRAFT_91641 [Clathrospora elynae]|uniref:Uncharacterized protein n=1 Tax=Clathrospora elynae TaxID=706981 RepID=A0A6A5T5R8_9PLEO|nr:hypothetical protein EJ02DRAFT_91641 [Clathrospora elynae]
MGETPQITTNLKMPSAMIKSADPSFWAARLLSSLSRVDVSRSCWTTLVALILPVLLLWALKRYRKMQDENRRPFPFMELPQELRDMVYENLLEDPVYPPPPPCQHQHSTLDWVIPGRRSSASAAAQRKHTSTWVFLASKQVYKEYMDLLCKKATFHLAVSPQNYKPLSTSTPSSPSSSSSSSSPPPPPPPDTRIWNLPQHALENIRTCSLKLVTTSAMLGVTDPRAMTSSSWTLGQRMRSQLKHMTSIKSFTLDAKALGDPLWNPLWIWYHASQSFKLMGTEFSDTVPIGPRLNKITFSLDTWSPGENYLARDEDKGGLWTWYCMKDHAVGADVGPEITVREFCGKLYQECGVCRPESDGEGGQ